MPDRVTVLIGSQDLLASFQSKPENRDAEAILFSDQQTREALDVIFDRHPDLLVLDRDFARTPRGTAIVGRLSGDPAFSGTRVLVLPEGPDPVAVPSWPGPPADVRGTRRVPRLKVKPGIDVQVDGAAARLIDLSTLGAQVISPTILKPNQRVRVSLPEPLAARAIAIVAWALFELPKGRPSPQYRAGLEFSNPDQRAMQEAILTVVVPEEGEP